MTTPVSDARSNKNEQIVYAAEAIGDSHHRALVFEAISFGRARIKSVGEIVERTGLSRKRVLEEGRKLVNKQVVVQTEKQGDVAYEKDDFLAAHRGQVLRLASNKRAREALPTKRRPSAGGLVTVRVAVPAATVRIRRITVDDIDSFGRIRAIAPSSTRSAIPERKFKRGLQAIIGEKGSFVDWGGESSDLWTTRVRIGGRRRAAAIALKGPGLRQRLTPGRMGKNGNQIQRLFTSPAQVFLVQHWREIDESVLLEMEAFARVRSLADGQEISFGVIDGQDSARLVTAYPSAFR
jgi:hypothetical protein